ncbi:MAG: MFS transporter [Campylobacteraceae bacterium]|nr:MFS transporter [Campylobacteraceae bacterium]
MQSSSLKISFTLFFVVSIIFSTIYTPQAILPVLKQEFHISILQTNLLLSGMLFVLMIATPFYIPIINRFEKKNIMVVCTFFLFISVLISALSTNFYTLLLSRFLQGIFLPGITAIILSYIQEIYAEEHRSMGIGIYMAGTSFGAVIGRLLVGWITFLYSWQKAFLVFAILLAIAFLVTLFTFPKVKKTHHEKKGITTKELLKYISNTKILTALLVPTIVFFSFMAISTFATYHLAQEPFNLNPNEVGNIFLVLILGIFISPLAGKFSGIFGHIKIIFIGIFLLILGIFLTLTNSVNGVIVGIAFVTMGMFCAQSASPSYIFELIPNEKEKIAIVHQTFFYLGGCLGTFLPSILWEYYEYEGVTYFCIFLLLFLITVLSFQRLYNKAE